MTDHPRFEDALRQGDLDSAPATARQRAFDLIGIARVTAQLIADSVADLAATRDTGARRLLFAWEGLELALSVEPLAEQFAVKGDLTAEENVSGVVVFLDDQRAETDAHGFFQTTCTATPTQIHLTWNGHRIRFELPELRGLE